MIKNKFLRISNTNSGYGPKGVILSDVFSVEVHGDQVTFLEECDGCFSKEMTRAEAIDVLLNIIKYVKETK